MYSLSPAKIESDRKRKKAGTSNPSTDRSAKHKKKSEMSSSSSSRDKVRASHILIKHEGSRRKASWKDPEGHVISNTTRESAVSQLKSLREDIVSGKAKFEDVAARYSDCSSAKRGGNLGKIFYFFLVVVDIIRFTLMYIYSCYFP